MASGSGNRKDLKDGYALPPIVEWLTFTVGQIKSAVNLFSTEVDGLLNECVNKNLTELLVEDYKSSKISERVIQEIKGKINKVVDDLRQHETQAQQELALRFPLLSGARNPAGNLQNGISSAATNKETSREDSPDKDEEDKTNIANEDDESDKSTSSSPRQMEDDHLSESDFFEASTEAQTAVSDSMAEANNEAGNDSGAEDTISSDDESNEREKSPILGAQLVSDEEFVFSPSPTKAPTENEPVSDEELVESPTKVPTESGLENNSNTESETHEVDPPNISINVDAVLEPPTSPAETVFFDMEESKRATSAKSKANNKNSLLPPPSPPETVFFERTPKVPKLDPPQKNTPILEKSDPMNLPPPSPPETVFLGKPNRRDPDEAKAKNLILESDDDINEPPSPPETVIVKRPNVTAPFKPPKKVKVSVKPEKDDDELPSTSEALRKQHERNKRHSKDKEGSDLDVLPKDDPKLKPGASFVWLERLPSIITDKLRSHKTIDLGFLEDKPSKAKHKKCEPEDLIAREIRRLIAFDPRQKERSSIGKPKKSNSSSKKNKVTSDDEIAREDLSDASTDSSNDGPIPARKALLLTEKDKVGSEDEDLGGSSKSSDEDGAKRMILKKPEVVKKENGSSSGEEIATKKREPHYVPARVPKEQDSEDSDSDFVSKRKTRSKKTKKIISILSDSDDDSKKSVVVESDDDYDGSSSSEKKSSRRKRRRASTDSDSDYKKKKTRRRVRNFSDSDDSSQNKEKKKKKKHKKDPDEVVIDDSSGSDIEEITEDSPSKGRKNIRGIKKKLQKETKMAEKNEEERKKRIAERQAEFNEHFHLPMGEVTDSLVLDYDPETKEPTVSVDSVIVKKMKPHQVDGVRFLWNSCFESLEQFKKKNNDGGGCILAHCMGLGKTLQSVAFIHTVLTTEVLGMKMALVICPLNTVGNWSNELKLWTRNVDITLNIHKIYDEKNLEARVSSLAYWQRRGGVAILHYDAYRSLVDGKRLKKSSKAIVQKCLVDPGPDIVICDEGHIFKNAKSKMSQAVSKIKTRRRVVLTGTPLQNNLDEYHCMMGFVKPGLLGSLSEFRNRFINPIANGQHKDSTAHDVKVMKRRAHVLHKLLDGCVQRLDYTVLTPYLPPKYEYVVLIKMSKIQKTLYMHYLESIKAGKDIKELVSSGQVLKHAANLAKVWCHPYALEIKSANYNPETSSDSAGSLKEFIDDRSDVSSCSDSDSDVDWLDSQLNVIKSKEKKNSVKVEEEVAAGPPELSSKTIQEGGDWWTQFFKSKVEMQLMEHSTKLKILFDIIKTCESIQDKVLVFSQYLYSLDIIESFLDEMDQLEKDKKVQDTFPPRPNNSRSRWRKNIEYFRIDGSTKSADRQKNCDIFNKTDVSRAKLFLISTKAGGLGINLIGANRVVLFDASWNPSQDMQSIFRVYRFGQTKPCYIYRLLAKGTIEEKIYNRQVVKLSLSRRVVDEHQIESHFTYEDIKQMYVLDDDDSAERPTPTVPKDRLLADLLISHQDVLFNYLEHDSLLQNRIDEGLTEEERKLAWEEYQNENRSRENRLQNMRINEEQNQWLMKIRDKLRIMNPNLDESMLSRGSTYVLTQLHECKNYANTFPMGDPVQQPRIDYLKKVVQECLNTPNHLTLQLIQSGMYSSAPSTMNQGGIHLAPLQNILEVPTQQSFLQHYRPSIINRRIPNQPVRRAIPTTTVPYSPNFPATGLTQSSVPQTFNIAD